MKIAAVILAAGKGTRMGEAEIPKVMFEVNGKPIIEHMIEDIENSGIDDITLVVGYKQEIVKDYFKDRVKYALQTQQLGTGHAVLMAQENLEGKSDAVLVCYGDHATYKKETIKKLIEKYQDNKPAIAMLTVKFEDPMKWQFGRIIRDKEGNICENVEQKDANEEQLTIKESNPSFYIFDSKFLWENLKTLNTENTQGEYYLTDMIKVAKDQGKRIISSPVSEESEVLGINTQEHLKEVEEILVKRSE